MTPRENFRLNERYTLTDEDRVLIARHSSNPLNKEDWNKSGLSSFKERVRRFLAPRQQRLCAYCRTRIDDATFYYEIEHIVPKSTHLEWMFAPQNFCLACRRCNAKKLDNETLVDPSCSQYPQDGYGFNIINPYYDTYSDHIELIEGVFYCGLTPKGTKTIDMCNLTRYELVLHRIEIQYTDGKDSFTDMLTWLPKYGGYVDNFDALIKSIIDDIEHLIF